MSNRKNKHGLTFPVTITNEWRAASFCEGLTPRALKPDSPDVRSAAKEAIKAGQVALIGRVAEALGATIESIEEVGHE